MTLELLLKIDIGLVLLLYAVIAFGAYSLETDFKKWPYERRYKNFFKKFGGGIGSRTYGACTPFRVLKTPSFHKRYPSVKWGDRSVLSDFSLSQAECSRSHERRPHPVRGRTDSRRGSPSISNSLALVFTAKVLMLKNICTAAWRSVGNQNVRGMRSAWITR